VRRLGLCFALLFCLLGSSLAHAIEPVPVDVNNATEQQLEQLPGIGPKKAQAIVLLRKKKPITRLTQLMEVRGIGKKTLERLKPFLRIDAVPAAAPVAPAAALAQAPPHD
jgi:competence protein ComEA